MATKKKVVSPEKVETVEQLEIRLEELRAAQKEFATFTQEQVDKIFMQQQLQQIRIVFHLLRWQLKKPVWVL